MDLDSRLKHIEIILPSKVSFKQIENRNLNFDKNITIKDSHVLSLDTLPKTIRIPPEDSFRDFSNFAMKWFTLKPKVISYNETVVTTVNVTGTKLKCSDTGKYQVLISDNIGIYLSVDSGNSFILFDEIDEIIIDISICNTGNYIAVISNTGIYFSKDYGSTFTFKEFSNLNCVNISGDGKQIYIGTTKGLYILREYGDITNLLFEYNIKDLVISHNAQFVTIIGNDNTIWYSNSYGLNMKQTDLISDNIWNKIDCSLTGEFQTIYSNIEDEIPIIYISNNYGETWNKVNINFYDTINDISITGSGKYQLMCGTNIYISKNYGISWSTFEMVNPPFQCICLSKDGKLAVTCSEYVYLSLLPNISIQESGMVNFKPLEYELISSSFTLNTNLILNTEIHLSNTKISVAISKTGEYQTICIQDGNIWTSKNFGDTFNSIIINNDNWFCIAMSDSGKYQTICTNTNKIYRSDDYGTTFILHKTLEEGVIIMDVGISGNGKYQTVITKNGDILFSYNYGFIWLTRNVTGTNLNKIIVSNNGQIQNVFDSNGNIFYSKNYGMRWRTIETNYNWKNVSSSISGEFQSAILNGSNKVMISDDYGKTWSVSNSITSNFSFIDISNNGQYQIVSQLNGKLYLSVDFGMNWTVHTPGILNFNWKSVKFSQTMQYIIAVNNTGVLVSKLNGNIPGIVNIKTNYPTNDHSVILISGNTDNNYYYQTYGTDNFDIISSDISDSGSVSYAIISYGQTQE
jgi:photosystem II stability/assembly factor-like uncharacterized protein